MSKFTVTRQKRYIDGISIVEITAGGLDNSNADALCKKYDGEFETFTGMTPAVDTAIEIAKKWQEDDKENIIYIGYGDTHGMGLPLDEMELNEDTYKTLREVAEKHDEELPKCAKCGDILAGETYKIWDDPFDDQFCSEHCCNEEYYRREQELEDADV